MDLAAPVDESALWRQLRAGDDGRAREGLLALHLPYARIVAASYYGKRQNDEIEFADYLQLASMGLLEALERFDPARGVQFRTFAARRMHGAILDGIERLTEKQQQIAARRRLRAQAAQDVKALALEASGAAGTPPRSAQQLLRFVAETGIGLALCWLLEGSGMIEDPDAAEALPFYRSAELAQLRARIREAVDALPAQQRSVIRAHYLQDMPFDAIAAMLQLTRGRISQVHRQALLHLRAAIGEHADWTTVF